MKCVTLPMPPSLVGTIVELRSTWSELLLATCTDKDDGAPRHCETSVKPVPSLEVPTGHGKQAWLVAFA